MTKLNKNQINFNNELFLLLNKHGIGDDQFIECVKALFPNKLKLKTRKIPKVAEFETLDEVNEFIKDKSLRGTGVCKHEYKYVVNYYENN